MCLSIIPIFKPYRILFPLWWLDNTSGKCVRSEHNHIADCSDTCLESNGEQKKVFSASELGFFVEEKTLLELKVSIHPT